MNKPKTLFTFDKLSARLIKPEDLGVIQTLLEACDDFSILVTGNPYEPNAAKDLLLGCPSGIGLENKYVIGFFDQKGMLVGLLDAIRGYPKPEVWFIGLLLFLPDERNIGLGEKAMKYFEDWILSQGAIEVRLGVVENNKAAIRFWEKLGFNLLEKRPPAKFGQKNQKVLVYQRILTSPFSKGK